MLTQDSSGVAVQKTSLSLTSSIKRDSKACGTKFKETSTSQWSSPQNAAHKISDKDQTATWTSSTELDGAAGGGARNTVESEVNSKIAKKDHPQPSLVKAR